MLQGAGKKEIILQDMPGALEGAAFNNDLGAAGLGDRDRTVKRGPVRVHNLFW